MPDGRIMVPSTPATRGEVEPVDAKQVFAGPDGRFYLPSEDKKSEKDRVTDPVEQAAAFAGQPPTKEEMRSAKKEQVAAEKAAASTPTDPAAETSTENPVEDASETAGDPPVESTDPPGKNASREAWVKYAQGRGMTDEELEPLTRNDIRDRYTLL